MKIYGAAVLAISCIPSTVAFVGNTHKSVNTGTQLSLQKENGNNDSWNNIIGPAVTGLAGLTLASQMAVAANVDPSMVTAASSFDATTPIVRGEEGMWFCK